MKCLICLAIFLVVSQSFANGLGEKFCQEKATSFFQGYHQRVLDEAGVIQGYSEDVSMHYSQQINEIDQRDETYRFFVRAENDEGEWWETEYVVSIEAWLEAGGKAHICTVTDMNYLGVTSHSAE